MKAPREVIEDAAARHVIEGVLGDFEQFAIAGALPDSEQQTEFEGVREFRGIAKAAVMRIVNVLGDATKTAQRRWRQIAVAAGRKLFGLTQKFGNLARCFGDVALA